MVASGARSVLTGVIAGAGAGVAHTLSGGEVTPAAGLIALTLSLALGPLLVRTSSGRTVDPLRVGAVMLLAQGVWHVVFMAGAGTSGAGHGAHHTTAQLASSAGTTGSAATAPVLLTLAMLAAHLLVAALGTAVAVGLDRSLVRATARVAAALLPRPLVLTRRPATPAVPGPVITEALDLTATARLLVVRVLRGPPAPALSALPG